MSWRALARREFRRFRQQRGVHQKVHVNIGIWFVGAVYSWWWHEELPGLREADGELEKTKQERKSLKSGQWSDEYRLAKDRFDNETNNNEIAKNAAETTANELQGKIVMLERRANEEKALQQQALERVLRKYATRLVHVLNTRMESGVVIFQVGDKSVAPGEFGVSRFKVSLT